MISSSDCKKRFLLVVTIVSCALLLALLGGNETMSAQTARSPRGGGIDDPAIDKRVADSCERNDAEEKVGQLVQYSAGQPTGPGTGRTDYEDMIGHRQIGSLFNVTDPKQINAYQHIAMEKTRLHIPILFGLDVIHGFKTEFPDSAGNGFDLGPGHCGESRACGCDGSGCRRHSLDISSNGRHCAGCALGTDG